MRILLVDDHELFRAGLKLLLRDLAEDLDYAEAASCAQALQVGATQPPDLVLLDLHLPDAGPLEALARVRQAMEGTVIVALSAELDSGLIRGVIEHGAAGFIPKNSAHAVMMAALRLVLAGGVYLPPHVLARLHANAPPARVLAPPPVAGSDPVPAAVPGASLGTLSGRQIDVLRCAVHGKPNKLIARELDISEATVKAHLSSAFRALGVRNRTEAVFAAAAAGLSAP